MPNEVIRTLTLEGTTYDLGGGDTARYLYENDTVVGTDNEPYLSRACKDIGNGYVSERLIGATYCMNQLIYNGNFTSTNNWSRPDCNFSVSNNVATITAYAQWGRIYNNTVVHYKKNHIYYATAIMQGSTNVFMELGSGLEKKFCSSTDKQKVVLVVKRGSTVDGQVAFGDQRTSGWTTFTVENAMILDITQMFGGDIADKFYELEQAEQDSGMAWLQSFGFLTQKYYDYSAGKLQGIQCSGRVVSGKNLINPDKFENGLLNNDGTITSTNNWITSEYIPVSGNIALSGYKDGSESNFCVRFCQYNNQKIFIQNTSNINTSDASSYSSIITLNSNTKYVRITFGFDNKVTTPEAYFATNRVQLEKNIEVTTYEPYTSVTFPFDQSLSLHGGISLDDDDIVYDGGDTYEGNGKVTRAYGHLTNKTGAVGSTITLTGAKSDLTDIITTKGHLNEVGTISGTTLTLTTAFSNDEIVYELATPITETANPFSEVMLNPIGGTETFLSEIPVPHEGKYYTFSEGKFQLPTSPECDGKYVLTKTPLGCYWDNTLQNDKVLQNNSSINADYRVLLSGSNTDNSEISTANKSTKLKYNPSKGSLMVGENLLAGGSNQTVLGKNNVEDSSALLVIGKGSSSSSRSNALKVDSNGNLIMSTQIKTSFHESVAPGSYQASANNIEGLVSELRYSSGAMGSVSIGASYTKDGITIGAGWYNFLWVPHRTGGVNGNGNGDNTNYGSLYLTGMSVTGFYLIRYSNSVIAELKDIYHLYGVATTSANGLMSSSDKSKLDGIANGAEVNQNAFSNVKVGSTTIAADAKTDTLELAAGNNITLTPDDTNDKVTIAVNGLGTAAAKNATDSYSSTGTDVTTGKAVAAALGTLDVTGASSIAASKTISAWSETDGKVSISTQDISITKSQVSDFPTLGTAAAKDYITSVTQNSTDLVTSGAVWSYIESLPDPMIMMGTLGTDGTITSLPTASADNEGHTYKVITAGTYASQAAKVGDFFVSCKPEGASAYSWVWFPSGDESFTDTWRNIKINGTEKLGTGISSGAVDFVNGTNTTVEFDATGNKIKINSSYTDTNTHRPIQVNGTQNLGDNVTPLNLKNGTNITVTADGGNVTIATNAEANQNAFSNVKVGSTTIAADTKTDTIEIAAGSNITLTPDATNDKLTIAATDTNTTYTFANGTNGFTVTPSNGTAQTVTVTPSITNNVTGSGTSGYLTKFNGTNTITNGPQLGSSTTTYLRNDGSWATPTDTNTTYSLTQDSSDGHKITLTPSSGTAQTVTIPDNDTKNTAGSTNSTSKLYLIGATSQAANPQTYSNSTVYTENGNLTAGKLITSKSINQLLTGTGTTAQDKGSGVSPRYFPAKWTMNVGIATPADGDMVTIKIPCAGHDFGVFLSLDNGTTYKPIGVKTQDNGRLTTHYPNGRIITLIYDSTAVVDSVFAAAGADARSNITGAWKVISSYMDGNYYDRNVFGWTNIKAWGTALTAGNIIVGINGVFHHLKEGTAFDITYPILYLNANVGANGTNNNVYDCLNFTITTTQSITLTQYLPVYIKGTLNGTTFTPVSTTPLTQTVPTTADGYTYIELGIASSTTAVYMEHRHKILRYLNGKFGEIVNAATWSNWAETASTARKIVNDTIRMTTADTGYSDAGLRYYLSSSNMTTNKPVEDGGIIHMPWDSTAGWATQLFVGHASAVPKLYVRTQNDTTWKSWQPVGVFTQTAPTTGQVVITDGTNGGIKSSGYTIAKSVPSNADFTNTWRPVQNNLTSDSTTDSLSAAQGKALATGSARDSTKVAKAGDSMTGGLAIDVATGGNYNEGIRLNKCTSNNSATLLIGAANGSTTGTTDGAFWIGTNNTRKLYIGHNSSTQGSTYFSASSSTDYSPSLQVGGSLTTLKRMTSNIINNFKTGTGTVGQDKGTSADPRYFPTKWTFNFGQNPSDGDVIYVKLPCAGHDFGDFISIDNGTTYKPVTLGPTGNGRMTTHYGNGAYVSFVYDANGATDQVIPAAGGNGRSNLTGGCWRVYNFYDTGNTYDRNRNTGYIKCGSTAIVAGNIIVGKDNVYHHLKDGSTFDITYPILYAAGAIAANATSNNNYDVLYINITTTQSITLTAYKPVYIKGTLSGTIFTPINTTPLTQTVPTSEDGYYYILLGMAVNGSEMYLNLDHRIFAYKNDAFQEVPTIGAYVLSRANVSGNMNNVAYRNAMGMINLSGTDTTINPNGQTGWHHFINISYLVQPDNMWQTQIANAAGTTDLWVRSRSGGTVTDGTAWKAPWTRILTGSNWSNVVNLTSLGAASSSHTHGLSIATDSGTSSISLAANTKYKLTAGGSTYVFTTPPDNNTDTNVTQTATNTNANYEVLFSETADNTTRTEGARKNSNLLFNPSNGILYGTNEMRSRDLSVSATNGISGGISLYGTSGNMDNYGIYFRQTSNKEKHGYVQADWATYFTMNDQDNRGWIFRRNKTTGNVASINTNGNAVFNGSITVGGNATNTSGARMEFNSVNNCIDFVFV